MTNHANCIHAHTKADRAKCRRDRAAEQAAVRAQYADVIKATVLFYTEDEDDEYPNLRHRGTIEDVTTRDDQVYYLVFDHATCTMIELHQLEAEIVR